MRIKQISVFLEDKPGRLVGMLETLGKEGISIRALSISETTDFGIVRVILADAEAGAEALRRAGFVIKLDRVLSAEVPDVPGGLLEGVAKPLAQAGVNLKYFYAYIEPMSDKAMVVLKTDDLEKAERVLETL